MIFYTSSYVNGKGSNHHLSDYMILTLAFMKTKYIWEKVNIICRTGFTPRTACNNKYTNDWLTRFVFKKLSIIKVQLHLERACQQLYIRKTCPFLQPLNDSYPPGESLCTPVFLKHKFKNFSQKWTFFCIFLLYIYQILKITYFDIEKKLLFIFSSNYKSKVFKNEA